MPGTAAPHHRAHCGARVPRLRPLRRPASCPRAGGGEREKARACVTTDLSCSLRRWILRSIRSATNGSSSCDSRASTYARPRRPRRRLTSRCRAVAERAARLVIVVDALDTVPLLPDKNGFELARLPPDVGLGGGGAADYRDERHLKIPICEGLLDVLRKHATDTSCAVLARGNMPRPSTVGRAPWRVVAAARGEGRRFDHLGSNRLPLSPGGRTLCTKALRICFLNVNPCRAASARSSSWTRCTPFLFAALCHSALLMTRENISAAV
jgi:hypothetical protein